MYIFSCINIFDGNKKKKKEAVLVGSNLIVGTGYLLMFAGGALTASLFIHSLGVLLDPGLLLEAEVVAMASGAYYQLREMHKLQPTLPRKDFVMVTHALVTSRLDH